MLRAALDAAVQESHPDGSFAESVRPWLGDFGALGVLTFDALVDDDPSNSSDLPSAVLAQITDRAAAEAFFETIMTPGVEAGYFELHKTAALTTYSSPDPSIPLGLTITDDVLALTLAGLDWSQLAPAATLADDPTFQRGLAALPADDYNVALYLSGAGLDALVTAQADGLTVFGMDSADVAQPIDGVLVGLTILDGTALTIDAATLLDVNALDAVQAVLGGGILPLDPAFDALLPGDSQFVLRGTDLRATLGALVDAAALADPGARADLQEVADTIAAGVQQTMGLDVDADVVSWLTGDFGVVFNLDPNLVDALYNAGNEPPTFARFPFDFGLVVAAVDPAKAQALVAALSDWLPGALAQDENTDATLALETIGDHNAIVVSIPVESGDFNLPPLEVLIGASADAFVVGTRPVMTAALQPGDGLAGQSSYAQARAHALPDATSFGYIANAGVLALGDLFGGAVLLGPQIGDVFTDIENGMVATLTPEQQTERERQMQEQQQQAMLAAQMARVQIQSVLGLIDSLTFSTASGATGVNLDRFTLTLAPAP